MEEKCMWVVNEKKTIIGCEFGGLNGKKSVCVINEKNDSG